MYPSDRYQAEAHDIPTIGNSSLTPDAILAKCSPDHPARGSKQIGTTPDGIYSNGETMVELDKETQPDNTLVCPMNEDDVMIY
jgi:hypothetical protein